MKSIIIRINWINWLRCDSNQMNRWWIAVDVPGVVEAVSGVDVHLGDGRWHPWPELYGTQTVRIARLKIRLPVIITIRDDSGHHHQQIIIINLFILYATPKALDMRAKYFMLSAWDINSCARLTNSCTWLFNSFARDINSLAQDINSCARDINLFAWDMNLCARNMKSCIRDMTYLLMCMS